MVRIPIQIISRVAHAFFLKFYVYTHAQTACKMSDSSWCARLMPKGVFIEYSKIHSKILNDKNIIAIFGVIGQNFGPVYLASIYSWAGRFESCLVQTPQDRCSHDAAQISPNKNMKLLQNGKISPTPYAMGCTEGFVVVSVFLTAGSLLALCNKGFYLRIKMEQGQNFKGTEESKDNFE